jgi:acyl-CoA synthetase (AMP-forming)/AMP-acid ligase II
MGVSPGMRLVLMVRFSIEFVSLVFAAFKAGAVVVLVDPGMGLLNALNCLEEIEPEGFLAIPPVHAVRLLNRRRFRKARHNLTVGRRWFWGGPTYRALIKGPWQPFEVARTSETDPAAVIFTSGSTGPPKGVLYEHGMFAAQVDLIRDHYRIEPGGIDLSGFPLFGLFNAAMGMTTVVPPMNPSKPARANPRRIVEAINDQSVIQSFGSPALWNRVSRYCEQHSIQLPTLRRVLSAGAPVPTVVLERMLNVLSHPEVEMHTPYGATEALPVCSISAKEVIETTSLRTRCGAGTCVGKPFPGVRIKIIEISDAPIRTLADAHELAMGQIGELVVQGPSITRQYVRRPDANALSKIADNPASGEIQGAGSFWHRMGDVGYLDDQERFWYCGRKSHIVTTSKGLLFTEPCEAIFNEHPHVFRSALVGVGPRAEQIPVMIVEPERGHFPLRSRDRRAFSTELRDLAAANPLTLDIQTILFHRSLPVDVRHNSKINREHLALWAANALHGRK